MDEAKRGEIAIKVMRYLMVKRGVPIGSGMIRELGNVSKQIDVPLDDLKAFCKFIMGELVETVFALNKKSTDN